MEVEQKKERTGSHSLNGERWCCVCSPADRYFPSPPGPRGFKARTCINTTRFFTWLFHSTEIGVTVALLLWTVAMLLTVATTAMPQGNNF